MILREIKNMYVSKFQQIEYLEVNNDSLQYIDTGIKCSSNMTFDLNIYIPQYTAQAFWCFGGRDGITSDYTHIAYLNDTYNNEKDWRYGKVIKIQSGILGEGWHRFQSNSSGTLVIDNTITIATRTSTFSTDIDFYLLTLNLAGTPALHNTAPGARIKQSRIYISNVLVRDFIPVRVGSVGYLYDRVSKRLFGNKGTGNFVLGQDVNSKLQQIYQNKLIEGVDYETYDWLKYTNWSKPEGVNALLGAYLICNLKVTTILDFTIKLGETISSINNEDVELIVRSSTRIYYIRRSYRNNYVYLYNSASTVISGPHNLGSNLDFLITEEGLFVNDVQLINEKIEYINQFGYYGRSCTGSISSVTTGEGVDVLVPCTLLRSIPRNLDAQCKERQAGECGMIDLISGKFYGNVASSGTFTVENDIENNE